MSALECSRPVCFETGDEAFPYTQIGSCFVIRFRDRHWVITAKHLLTNFQFLANQVFVPTVLGGYDRFPLTGANTFNDYTDGDSECTDIVAFPIDQTATVDPQLSYDLDSETELIVTPRHILAVHGFPRPLNSVNHEEAVMFHQRLTLSARLVGTSSIGAGCFEIELLSTGDIDDHQGFSGAPVFVASSEFQQSTPHKLVGMVLRGSATSRRMHVLHHSAIRHLIDVQLAPTA